MPGQIIYHPLDDYYANVSLLLVFKEPNGSSNFKEYSKYDKKPSLNRNVIVDTSEITLAGGAARFELKDYITTGGGDG